VGALVGSLVGALVGALVGVLVGNLVGAWVGAFVGAAFTAKAYVPVRLQLVPFKRAFMEAVLFISAIGIAVSLGHSEP
jgi:phage tail tape-measure protein